MVAYILYTLLKIEVMGLYGGGKRPCNQAYYIQFSFLAAFLVSIGRVRDGATPSSHQYQRVSQDSISISFVAMFVTKLLSLFSTWGFGGLNLKATYMHQVKCLMEFGIISNRFSLSLSLSLSIYIYIYIISPFFFNI